jgi:hypothetical protein
MLNSNTPGAVPDFDPESDYVWTVATTASASIGTNSYALARLHLDTSAFSNSYGGNFALVLNMATRSFEIHYDATGTTLPQVTLASPTNSQYFNAPATIPLSLNANGNGHSLDVVTYYTNGVPVQIGAPFDPFQLMDLPAGVYDICAVVAYDGGFGMATSPTSRIVVLGPMAVTGTGTGAGGNFQLTFTGPTGQPYRVLGTDDLTAPLDQWTELASGQISGTSATFTDTNPAAHRQQFYRVVSP